MSAEEELSIWKTVNGTRSIHGLIETLEKVGDIEISGGRGAYNMADRVKQVHEAGGALNLLTRNFGIRQQYMYLVEYAE